jgi:hypothetical protein
MSKRIERMSRISKRNLMIAVATAAVIAGVIVAFASSSGGGHTRASSALARARAHAARAPNGTAEDAIAAGYLGLTKMQLRSELRSGRSLAQIAESTSNKSVAGLVDALVSARAAQLHAEVKAKRLSPAAERTRLAHLRRRLTTELERTPGYSGLPATARYLGVSTARVRADLHAGHSLAQIAAATPGKSSAGLIDARVTAREATLKAALASGKISEKVERELASDLRRRISAEVERKPTARPSP